MPNEKYKIVDATEEEKKDFMIKFNAFLTESGFYYEPVPQFSRDTLTSPWTIRCEVFLAKKIPNEELTSIPSPFTDENTKTD